MSQGLKGGVALSFQMPPVIAMEGIPSYLPVREDFLMLRTLVVTAALLPSLASAQTFGNFDTCRLYAYGGTHAVEMGGDNLSFSVSLSDDENTYLLVTPTSVHGHEFQCARAGDTLTCSGEGGEWTEQASIENYGSTLAFAFAESTGSITLQRCNVREALAPN